MPKICDITNAKLWPLENLRFFTVQLLLPLVLFNFSDQICLIFMILNCGQKLDNLENNFDNPRGVTIDKTFTIKSMTKTD